jgi:diguanylate cyclase (GGDEF)-like protein
VLVEVAHRLRTAARGEDCVARFAGDEFTLMAENLSSPADALALAERVKEALAAPVPLHGRRLPVSSSTGVAVAPRDTSPFELLAQADVAMYVAKSNHRGGYTLFDPKFLAWPRLDPLRAERSVQESDGVVAADNQPHAAVDDQRGVVA